MNTVRIRNKIKSVTGVSLLEVLVSMVILAFGVAGLAPMMALSIDSNQISKYHQEANELAIEAIEQYEEGSVAVPAAPHTGVESAIAGMFDRYTAVTDNASDSTIPAGYSKINVVVQWTNDRGKTQSVNQSALIGS